MLHSLQQLNFDIDKNNKKQRRLRLLCVSLAKVCHENGFDDTRISCRVRNIENEKLKLHIHREHYSTKSRKCDRFPPDGPTRIFESKFEAPMRLLEWGFYTLYNQYLKRRNLYIYKCMLHHIVNLYHITPMTSQ